MHVVMSWSRRRDEHEDGFTLIELLVVIIIIGILAAIAIPVFLSQREKGYDTTAKADLRNLANFEEIYLNDFGSYGTATQLLTDEPEMEISAKDKLSIEFNGSTAYCLEAQYTGSPDVWFYDSLAGGLLAKGQVCTEPGIVMPADPSTANGGQMGTG